MREPRAILQQLEEWDTAWRINPLFFLRASTVFSIVHLNFI